MGFESPAFLGLFVLVTVLATVSGFRIPIREERSVVSSSGYIPFKRTTVFAHKVYSETKKWEDAEKHCQKDGAHLSGFDSVEEAKFIENLVVKTIGNNRVYLGARRIKECEDKIFYSNNTADPCYRGKVLQWENNVASRWIANELWGVDDEHSNPSNHRGDQDYLVMYAGDHEKWISGMLDDQKGHVRYPFVCGKYVEVEEGYGQGFERA